MGIKSMIRFCYVTLAVILISTNASAMISGEEDYQRADTLHRLADKVYSLGVVPEWIGDSHYFWYKNRERTGSVFYLVNAENGEKQRAGTLEELKKLLPEIWKVTDKKEKKKPVAKDGKVMSPDGKWLAYIRDNNVYIASSDKNQGEEVPLSIDGTFDCFYDANLYGRLIRRK